MLSAQEVRDDLAKERENWGRTLRDVDSRVSSRVRTKKGPSRYHPHPTKVYAKYVTRAKKKVLLLSKEYASSGNHEVVWTTNGNIKTGEFKDFASIADAFSFAKKQAIRLGDWTLLDTNVANYAMKYVGTWVVAEGKLIRII